MKNNYLTIRRSIALGILLSALPAAAAISLTKDSSAFDYRYEMGSQPNNQDLDGNGTDDWLDAGVPTVGGGYAVNTGADQLLLLGGRHFAEYGSQHAHYPRKCQLCLGAVHLHR